MHLSAADCRRRSCAESLHWSASSRSRSWFSSPEPSEASDPLPSPRRSDRDPSCRLAGGRRPIRSCRLSRPDWPWPPSSSSPSLPSSDWPCRPARRRPAHCRRPARCRRTGRRLLLVAGVVALVAFVGLVLVALVVALLVVVGLVVIGLGVVGGAAIAVVVGRLARTAVVVPWLVVARGGVVSGLVVRRSRRRVAGLTGLTGGTTGRVGVSWSGRIGRAHGRQGDARDDGGDTEPAASHPHEARRAMSPPPRQPADAMNESSTSAGAMPRRGAARSQTESGSTPGTCREPSMYDTSIRTVVGWPIGEPKIGPSARSIEEAPWPGCLTTTSFGVPSAVTRTRGESSISPTRVG